MYVLILAGLLTNISKVQDRGAQEYAVGAKVCKQRKGQAKSGCRVLGLAAGERRSALAFLVQSS